MMGEKLKEKEFNLLSTQASGNKLAWSHHINHIKLKISKGIAILTKLRNSFLGKP